MGRLFIRLDPEGYYRVDEPGFEYLIYGSDLLRKLGAAANGVKGQAHFFYNPPGSEWMLPTPLQFDPDWQRGIEGSGSTLGDHVLPKASWAFAGGITSYEFEYSTKRPDGTTSTYNKWVSVPRVPNSFTSLLPISFSGMASAAGVLLPTGFGVVATCGTAPSGDSLAVADFAPFLQYGIFPGVDALAFGWGDLAWLIYRDKVYVLRVIANTWTLMTQPISLSGSTGVAYASGPSAGRQGGLTGMNAQLVVRSLMALPVGPDHVYTFSNLGDPVAARLRTSVDSTTVERMWGSGGWWVAAAPKQKLMWQAQVVGFGFGQDIGATPSRADLVDLGERYKPTQAPSLVAHVRMEASDPSDIVQTVDGDNNIVLTNGFSGAVATIGLMDEAGNPWDSDGTNSQLNLLVSLQAGSPAGGLLYPYLAPQLRMVELQFPIVLTPRVNDELLLDDTQYSSFVVGTSHDDPLGKEFELRLLDVGAAVLSDTDHDVRSDYPAHIEEDTTGDGTPDTVRARVWITHPLATKLVAEGQTRPGGGTLADPIMRLVLQGRGVLQQADEGWLYLPQLVNPDGTGVIAHPYAVARALRMAGIDTADTAVYVAAPDIWAGTRASWLPGTWRLQSGEVGQKVDSPWAPRWAESKIGYAERIAKTWAAWKIYEDLTLIRYHPDLLWEIEAYGAKYNSTATFYRSQADAVAASRPNQYYLISPTRRVVDPIANSVRITGRDTEEGLMPHVTETYFPSLTNISDVERFVGRVKIKEVESTMAVSHEDAVKLARVAIIQWYRRRFIWTVTVPMAPWDMGPGVVDAGRVVVLDGRGPYRVLNCEVELLKSATGSGAYYHTTLTCERLPGASTSGSAGNYPGHGV